MTAYRCIYPRCPETCCQCNHAVPESALEARAEGQSPAERPLTVTDEAKAESEPAVDLLRATVNRLMGERGALAGALREIRAEAELAQKHGDSLNPRWLINTARSALAQLDSVAPPLTPND